MQLKLYSREWCSWCNNAKDFLAQRGSKFSRAAASSACRRKSSVGRRVRPLGYFSDPQRDHARERERRLRARERRRLGLGRLPAILSFVLQGRGPRSGHHFPERAARSLILLSANFVAREGRHNLDHLELSAFLRLKAHSAIPNQSGASGPIILAALPKPPRVSPPKQRGRGR